jgi:hypothetical protein
VPTGFSVVPQRAEEFARAERGRDELLAAYSAYAAALTELKRGTISLWLRKQEDRGGPEHRALRVECDRLGAIAQAARFRIQLLSVDADVDRTADAAFTSIGELRKSTNWDELHRREDRFEVAVKDFIEAAAAAGAARRSPVRPSVR